MTEQQSVLIGMVNRWATPSGLLILLGAITWGVQLNLAIVGLTEKVSELDNKTDVTNVTQAEIAANVLKATILMQEMEKDVLAVVSHVNEHNAESAKWKQRIVRLEERVLRNQEIENRGIKK